MVEKENKFRLSVREHKKQLSWYCLQQNNNYFGQEWMQE